MMDVASRLELAARWRARAAHLEKVAADYRRAGDPEYADELALAALDNRTAADRLEAGASS